MDVIIQEADFVHNDGKSLQEFTDKVNQWRREHETCKASTDVVTALQSLNKKLMEPKCPALKSDGWKQVMFAYRVLEDHAKHQIVHGTINATSLHEVFYQLFIDWFHFGPASIHLEISAGVFNFLDMKDFTTAQQGDSLHHLLQAISSPVQKKEDTPDKQFYDHYNTYFGVFFRMAFTQTQLLADDAMKIMMDFVFHLYLDYTHLDEESLSQMTKQAKTIMLTYKTSWKDFSDIPRLKSYIKRFSDLAQTPSFPRNKAMANLFYESLTIITKQIQKPGQVEEFCDEMFDLLGVLSQCQGEVDDVIRVFSAAVVFFDQKNNVKNQPAVFKAVAPRFRTLLEVLDPVFLSDTRFITDLLPVLENSYANNSELTSQWLELSVPLLRRQPLKSLNACRNILQKYDKVKWKEHEPLADKILEVVLELQVPTGKDKEEKSKEITCIISYVLRGLKKSRILKNFGERVLHLSIYLLELREPDLFEAVEDAAENIVINVKDKKEVVMNVMRRLHDLLKDESLPWFSCIYLQRAVLDLIESLLENVKDGAIFSDEDFKVFISMCKTCLEKDGISPETGHISAFFLISLKIKQYLFPWLSSTKKMSFAADLIPLLLKKFEEDEEDLYIATGVYLVQFGVSDASILVPYLEKLVEIYIDKEIVILLDAIYQVYINHPVAIENREQFQTLITCMIKSSDMLIISSLSRIVLSVAKKQAELFTEENVKAILHQAKEDKENQEMFLMIVQDVCKRRPTRVIKHSDLLMEKNVWNSSSMGIVHDIQTTLAFYDKNISNTVVDYCIVCVSDTQEKSLIFAALNSVRLIAYKYPDTIKSKRDAIEKLSIVDPEGQGQKQNILDMIDGKTSEEMRKQLDAQEAAMGELVEKVDEVEEAVASAVEEMEGQKQEMDNVKIEMSEQTQRLDHVTETLQDTVLKVEEIDNKTLSHAPYWSRDLSKLMNPATDHDWRLLSSRLGYSNDDIRGWAQQSDPCMAMLNEWYATRKTSEATNAILNHLVEMNRTDAALIVENAMKNVEAVVEDEEFEYAAPPEIFISYQWGHQPEAKLLHRHLAMAGYDCWLDVGQMGGGDKLFDKIDTGMRAAKLVISCVTSKYAKSPNCNREVNLAVGVKKPIIPLLLENCPWPPPGSMGPIFSESLYIQFFQTDQDQTPDDRYWPEEKFQELLMQLSVNGLTPDEGKIEPIYRNWWKPLEEEIKIDKSKTRNGGKSNEATKQEDSSQMTESPEVFISYQWGKQKNIIQLYQRLSSLGFSCWLDIKQMGGGDSLYDKIDRGIRGSKIVLSCVTKKYALSPNCRREVSLTDALKKPMVPLLLEEMTWPPQGPMSMIMTPLLYIGFQQELSQSDWEGPEFEQLVAKLKSHLENDSCAGMTPCASPAIDGNMQPIVGKDSADVKRLKTQSATGTNEIKTDSKPDSSTKSSIVDDSRPRSAVPRVFPPVQKSSQSKDLVLPPPHLRLQTSRSCQIL